MMISFILHEITIIIISRDLKISLRRDKMLSIRMGIKSLKLLTPVKMHCFVSHSYSSNEKSEICVFESTLEQRTQWSSIFSK